ncbi:tRNA (guanosine(46)-N7)-methyltransferase TrmB [Aestuariibacter halophilus]|uniref:tRNA (guanine-N(7)-)-methyltransferase n=1 Tax=Fluctibacter halophilus TaxID=226011 RepID=A0ABS8GBQ9_9ALTE|nr:tRNA (guanosine(46)-N7)-methyltransferase TrmB [Aestuariibacter halophilus]MCC2617666.1 tRNA (guanosine(46)-N7)-methyltransferase TrmB [Aestuariibacter halophilus]
MSQFKTPEEAAEAGVYVRKIQSFVKREGRLTKAQARAIEEGWASMGLNPQDGLLDQQQVFGRQAPLVLEIGFGMGKSLVEMASNEPDKDFVGIEVHRPGVGTCINDALEAGLTNLKVYCHDGVEILRDCIGDASLSRVQLFFPDPWHKKRHHKRRIVQPDFVESLRHKLAIGGVFHMATDWENYAQHMLEVMQQAPGYTNLSATNDYVPRPERRPLTKFEQRGHRLGHGVWDLMFERSH